jgi:hypothetical protein
MRALIALAATAAFVFSAGVTPSPANAKEYAVKYMGSKALAATCARGGGSFHQSTAISHSCKYKNGNTRDCSSKSRTCVVITPDKARVQQATGVGGVSGGATNVYATSTLKCPGKNHEASTGTKGGKCIVYPGKRIVCTDGKNTSTATCEHGCGNTNGAGSCDTKSASLGTPPGPPKPRGKPEVASIPTAGGSVLDPGRGPTVTSVYASTTLECKNGDKYQVSTGSGHADANCKPVQGKAAACTDGHGNEASANCETGCQTTAGSGSCKSVSASLGTPPRPPQPRGKPGIAVIPPAGKNIVDRGGILDSGPGFGSQGPAATGAPLSTGRGSAPPPGKIN